MNRKGKGSHALNGPAAWVSWDAFWKGDAFYAAAVVSFTSMLAGLTTRDCARPLDGMP
jgi:hypothetical protein